MLEIGVDIIEIARVKRAIDRYKMRFIQRIFTQKEQIYCFSKKDPSHAFAARFAAKEAVAKALGTGIGESLSWQDISIERKPSGAPVVILSEKASLFFNNPVIRLSISHSKRDAIAFAVWEKPA